MRRNGYHPNSTSRAPIPPASTTKVAAAIMTATAPSLPANSRPRPTGANVPQ